MTSLKNKYGDWVFITPIDGLILTKDLSEEFIVNRVIFVSKEKLPRIRKRLHIPAPLSEFYKMALKKDKNFKPPIKDFFSSSKTFAVLPYKGTPEEKEKDCIRLIKDELSILSLSQLGWSKRVFNNRMEIMISDWGTFYRNVNINKHKTELRFNLRVPYSAAPPSLDSMWVKFHKRFFYFDLIKIIRGKTSVTKRWRTILHRAAIMAGQSQNSNDLPFCFLWNVIALEMLLTETGEKISDMLVKRCEYFLGWNKDWINAKYEDRIRDIYDKRCKFVHKGSSKYIEVKDLLFTDDLLFNILNNLIRCRHKIKEKKDIINYTEKFEAEKLLKQKSKYRIKKFELMRKHYTKDDYEKI